MSDYHCENHKLDLVCRGCLKAWIARHDKLLAFVKEIASNNYQDNIYDLEARDLLKEIGEMELNG